MENEIAELKSLGEKVNLVHQAMKMVMKADKDGGSDYGIIPGTKKPTLFKAGAEKLCQLFGLSATFVSDIKELDGEHVRVESKCVLKKIETDKIWASANAICTSMETKYRYRNEWQGGQKIQTENPNISDCHNTVLKIAEKRAYVAATLFATGASGIFTQDLEDLPITNGNGNSHNGNNAECVPCIECSGINTMKSKYNNPKGTHFCRDCKIPFFPDRQLEAEPMEVENG